MQRVLRGVFPVLGALVIVGTSSEAANAAPGDVRSTATSAGSTVTVTIINDSGRPAKCGTYGVPADFDASPEAEDQPPVAFSKGVMLDFPGRGDPTRELFTVQTGRTPVTFSDVKPGKYRVDWACQDAAGGWDAPGTEWWGTPGMLADSTAQSLSVTVSDPAKSPLFGSLS